MKKLASIIILLSLLGAVLFYGLQWFLTEDAAPIAQNNNLPLVSTSVNIPPVHSPEKNNIKLILSNGSSLAVKNFINDSVTVKDPINKDYYYIGSDVKIVNGTVDTSGAGYSIGYIASTNFFNISLEREPISHMRTAAEEYLMTKLNITREQACALKYMVSVPNRVNQVYAGTDLGFSFCYGATQL